MKRIFLVLAVMILPAMLFATGSRQQSSSGTNYLRFAWWGNTVRDERTVQLINLFMERNPGVIVETEPTAWAGYWDRMNTLVAAGNLPDVMQQDVSYINQYATRNQLEDLNPYVQRGLINTANWGGASGLGAGTINNRLVGLVLGTNAWGMGVDPAVLQQAGVTIDDTTWTWADYERIAIQIFQTTGIQSDAAANYVQITEHISRQYGVGRFSDDGRSIGISTNQDAYNAFKNYIDMLLRIKAAGALYDPEDGFVQGRSMEEEPLPRGRTWNGLFWSNQYIGQQAAAGRPLQYIMLPTVAGNKAPYGTYYRASMYISMLASSENKDLSARFIDFFANNLDANRILLAERGIPIPTDVRNDLYGRVSTNDQYLFDYISKIGPYVSPANPPYPAAAGETEDAMRPIMLRALLGQITSDAAVSQMVQTANAILSR